MIVRQSSIICFTVRPMWNFPSGGRALVDHRDNSKCLLKAASRVCFQTRVNKIKPPLRTVAPATGVDVLSDIRQILNSFCTRGFIHRTVNAYKKVRRFARTPSYIGYHLRIILFADEESIERKTDLWVFFMRSFRISAIHALFFSTMIFDFIHRLAPQAALER